MLDPQTRNLLNAIEAAALPPLHQLAPTEARKAYQQRVRKTRPEPHAVAAVEQLDCSGPGGRLAIRLYRASAAPAAPCLVFYHGGGWTIGDLDTHDILCRDLCRQAGCAVAAVDYRLAPESPFPAAVEDAVAAYRWLRDAAVGLGLDPSRLAVGGDSAGGNLAAVTSLLLRDARETLPRFQLLIYPATDMRALAPSHLANGQGYLLTADTVAYFRKQYTPEEAQWSDWRASPLLHPDLSGLPPALMLTAGFDPLRDEGRQYADALSSAGTPCQYVCFERQIHGFVPMGKALDEANTAVTLCALALRRALQPSH